MTDEQKRAIQVLYHEDESLNGIATRLGLVREYVAEYVAYLNGGGE